MGDDERAWGWLVDGAVRCPTWRDRLIDALAHRAPDFDARTWAVERVVLACPAFVCVHGLPVSSSLEGEGEERFVSEACARHMARALIASKRRRYAVQWLALRPSTEMETTPDKTNETDKREVDDYHWY